MHTRGICSPEGLFINKYVGTYGSDHPEIHFSSLQLTNTSDCSIHMYIWMQNYILISLAFSITYESIGFLQSNR